jgi:hypothetical protein
MESQLGAGTAVTPYRWTYKQQIMGVWTGELEQRLHRLAAGCRLEKRSD